MNYTIDSVSLLENGNLSVTFTDNGIQKTVEVSKEKVCALTCGNKM